MQVNQIKFGQLIMQLISLYLMSDGSRNVHVPHVHFWFDFTFDACQNRTQRWNSFTPTFDGSKGDVKWTTTFTLPLTRIKCENKYDTTQFAYTFDDCQRPGQTNNIEFYLWRLWNVY